MAHSYGGRRMTSGGRPVGGTLHSLPAKEAVDLPSCSLHLGRSSSSLSSRGSRCMTMSSSKSSSELPGKGGPKAMPADHSRWPPPRICLGRGGGQGCAEGVVSVGRSTEACERWSSRSVTARRRSTAATPVAATEVTLAEVAAPIANRAAPAEAARAALGSQTRAVLDRSVGAGHRFGYHSVASLLRCRSTTDGKVGRPDPQYRRAD